jgi:hypothetical protein
MQRCYSLTITIVAAAISFLFTAPELRAQGDDVLSTVS